jgi:sugar phosphate isomerase/epimerase
MVRGSLSRRSFVTQAVMAGSAGLAATVSGGRAAPPPPFSRPLGFQLYTLRKVINTNPAGIFSELVKTGYTEVEVLRVSLDQLGPSMQQSGLRMVSGHFDAPLVTGNMEIWKQVPDYQPPPAGYDWKAAIAQARRFGLKYMVVPYLTPKERGDVEWYKALAMKLNNAARECAAGGMKLCYHHHAFEFSPVGGVLPLDILMDQTDRKLVGLEVDVFWVASAGQDPVALLKRFSGRVPLIHLKDRLKATSPEFNEKAVPFDDFKEVGRGDLDFSAILRSAAAAGVEHYFVEQDHTPGDPVKSLQESYRNLRAVST